MVHTFPSSERLKSETIIKKLFNKEGASFAIYPLRLIWLSLDTPITPAKVQFGVSVPKKKFKSAVARNRLKRQIRESWRINKHLLFKALENSSQQYYFMILYTANEALPYTQIEENMKRIIKKFIKTSIKG